MTSLTNVYHALPQLPGVEAPDLTFTQQMMEAWDNFAIMQWPLGLCILVGLVVIILRM